MDIFIEVKSEFLPQHSDSMRDEYAFAYHITIENRADEPLTLRNRHWEITDAHGNLETIDGAGVVGEEPILMPGDAFQYTSGARLHTPWGQMVGRYEFERFDGQRFWADIPTFDLKVCFTLH
ncbi:Co2+/Mg2+ efflux protein ApaG [Snodgrassella sp. CFCC 13594]|uniref:Co2+/Mg2+ efflux protein ApaG n=1 Tax=Snodgrassella sp. CFCC 13594 TaxID=1775559 RepID=UPI00082A4DDF|nr:Co2+/Mg2+ efflux protein ApaG [Snodgrassella sp. CFCC 13594]